MLKKNIFFIIFIAENTDTTPVANANISSTVGSVSREHTTLEEQYVKDGTENFLYEDSAIAFSLSEARNKIGML